MSEQQRELLGRVVRIAWVNWAKEQPEAKPSWLLPWEDLDDGQREVDCRIAEAIMAGTQPWYEVAKEAEARIADLQRDLAAQGRVTDNWQKEAARRAEQVIDLQRALDAERERADAAENLASAPTTNWLDAIEPAWRESYSTVRNYVISLHDALATERQTRQQAEGERDEIVAGWPWFGDLDGKTFAKAMADEMADFQMIIDHCSEIYMEASYGAISKPNTLPVNVISIMHERQSEEINEAVEEATRAAEARLADAVGRADKLAAWFNDHGDHDDDCPAGAPIDNEWFSRTYPTYEERMAYLNALLANCTCGYNELEALARVDASAEETAAGGDGLTCVCRCAD